MKRFNQRVKEILEDAGLGMTTTTAGLANTNPPGNIGQSGPSVYGPPDDARNLFGTEVKKPKKKSKFKAPKKNPGFKTPFKMIRRTLPKSL